MREFCSSVPVGEARLARRDPEQLLAPFTDGNFKPRYGSSYFETKERISIPGTLHEGESRYPTQINVTFPRIYTRLVARFRRREPMANVAIAIEDRS
jgi:hypothetical protein